MHRNNCVKKHIVCILLFVLVKSLFAWQGSMSGSGELRVSKTKWFDIIYSEKNEQSASILYENADDVFEKLAASYGIEPGFRLPVVITTTVEQFNAYFTYVPYNHIVIYDTAQIDDLAVFSQTLLSTFTHELTHALTYNLKSPFYKRLGNIFGDAFALHYLTVTSGMAEGATVSYESSNGEGRLNDSYFLQTIRQSKIEDKFPSYFDVQGASGSYPSGAFYNFNGAFAQWLQQKYGMQKYAQFWYNCVNVKNLTAKKAFKKIYGIKIKNAWKLFKDDFYIPASVIENPVGQGFVNDFFAPQKNDFSAENNAGSRYTSLTSCENGIAYIDAASSSVYFVTNEQIFSNKQIKPEKLFTQDNIDEIKLSTDGRFIAVSYYDVNSPTIKHKVKLYDVQYKNWIKIDGTNFAESIVARYEYGYFLISQTYNSQVYSIVIKNIADGKIIFQKNFGPEQVPSSFTDIGNGYFAYILKSELNYSICISDIFGNFAQEYVFPKEGASIKNLASCWDFTSGNNSSQKLIFSWATKETLPRFCILNLQNGEFLLSENDLSGGVYSPVCVENKLIYSAHFYRQNRLFTFNTDSNQFTFEKYEVNPELSDLQKIQNFENPGKNAVESIYPAKELPYQLFSSFDYAFEGLLLPLSTVVSYSNTLLGNENFSLPWGFTYITSLPWETGALQISAGYGEVTESVGFEIAYQGGTDTSLFTYSLDSSTEFDKNGWKQINGTVQLSNRLDFGTRSAVMNQWNSTANYGRVSFSTTDGKAYNDFPTKFLKFQTVLSNTYSNLIFAGPGNYEQSGFAFTSQLVGNYDKSSSGKGDFYGDLGFSLKIRVPKLIPVNCIYGFTYNLPLRLNFNLFVVNSGLYDAANVKAEAVIFGYNVQKAISDILFIDDIALSVLYTGGYKYGEQIPYNQNWHIVQLPKYISKFNKLNYGDYGTIKFSMNLSPNFGIFANSSFKLNFFALYNFGPSKNLPSKQIDIGLDVSLQI